MEINFTVVLLFILSLGLLYLLGRLLAFSMKSILKLLINALIGAALLLLFNWIGGGFGLHIGVNPITAIVVGLLGVPGMVLLLILQVIL